MRKRARWFLSGALVLAMTLLGIPLAHAGNDNFTAPDLQAELQKDLDASLKKALEGLAAPRTTSLKRTSISKTSRGKVDLGQKIMDTERFSGVSADAKVEVAFVIDTTGSMADNIRNVARNLTEFARYLNSKDVSLKFSVVEYRDITADGLDSTIVWEVDGSEWMEVENCVATLHKLKVGGGGDNRETPIDGLGYLLNSPKLRWDASAYKFAV